MSICIKNFTKSDGIIRLWRFKFFFFFCENKILFFFWPRWRGRLSHSLDKNVWYTSQWQSANEEDSIFLRLLFISLIIWMQILYYLYHAGSAGVLRCVFYLVGCYNGNGFIKTKKYFRLFKVRIVLLFRVLSHFQPKRHRFTRSPLPLFNVSDTYPLTESLFMRKTSSSSPYRFAFLFIEIPLCVFSISFLIYSLLLIFFFKFQITSSKPTICLIFKKKLNVGYIYI